MWGNRGQQWTHSPALERQGDVKDKFRNRLEQFLGKHSSPQGQWSTLHFNSTSAHIPATLPSTRRSTALSQRSGGNSQATGLSAQFSSEVISVLTPLSAQVLPRPHPPRSIIFLPGGWRSAPYPEAGPGPGPVPAWSQSEQQGGSRWRGSAATRMAPGDPRDARFPPGRLCQPPAGRLGVLSHRGSLPCWVIEPSESVNIPPCFTDALQGCSLFGFLVFIHPIPWPDPVQTFLLADSARLDASRGVDSFTWRYPQWLS